MSNKQLAEIAGRFEMVSLDGRVEFGLWDDLVEWWNSWECNLGDNPATPDEAELFHCVKPFK